MMATLLQEAIDSIRSAQSVLDEVSDLGPESRIFYEESINENWENIRLYRSDKTVDVFVVEGVADYEINYLDLKQLEDDLLDIRDVLETVTGLELTIRLKKMRARDFGRLEVIWD
jgi:hypothetical protein